jgi:hypothetical protein
VIEHGENEEIIEVKIILYFLGVKLNFFGKKVETRTFVILQNVRKDRKTTSKVSKAVALVDAVWRHLKL